MTPIAAATENQSCRSMESAGAESGSMGTKSLALCPQYGSCQEVPTYDCHVRSFGYHRA